MTQHVTAAELRRLQPGSQAKHERLVEACRIRLALVGIPMFTIYTGGIPKFVRGRGIVLTANPHQIGLSDAIALIRDACEKCGSVRGRLVLLEMKTGRARRSAAQIRTHTLFQSYGALALVVRNVTDLEGIIAIDRKARRAQCREAS